jgi:DNA-binding IclR family transcriptional regulator
MAFGPTTAMELADYLSCHPRTARRTLQRLVEDGWARQVGSPEKQRYELTLRVIAMAAQATQGSEFRQASIPVVERATDLMQRPVYLAVPCYHDVLCLAASERSPLEQGDIAPAVESAAGLVLLAHRDPWRESVMDRLPESDRPALDATLEQVRQQGYAVVADQVALPVRWRDDGVIGGLVVAGVQANALGTVAERASAIVASFDAEAPE